MVTIFAYGSNMLRARMLERVASAQLIGPAFLDCFVLRWNKRSSRDGSGKCSIEETGRREDFVWGVLYELGPTEKKRLDVFEGLGRGYGERTVTVLSEGKLLRAVAYYATSVDLNIKPYDWYRELVIAGAKEHGLPLEYIQRLEAVPCATDPDTARAALNRALCKTD